MNTEIKHDPDKVLIRSGFVRIAINQLVGDGNGFSHLRDLYENKNGARISIQKSKWKRAIRREV